MTETEHHTPTIESDIDSLQRSARDTTELPTTLADWIAAREGSRPDLHIEGDVTANGMSSETIMVTAQWPTAPATPAEHWVMRMAPRAEDIPVFDTYRLDHQYEAMRLAATHSGLPVPAVHRLEPTGEVLGSPFFLMDRIDGHVPPDVMPYTFGDNWLFDASPNQQRQLQDRTVEVIAALHSIPDAANLFGFLRDELPDGPSDLHRRFAWLAQWYESSAALIGRSPLVDEAMSWLGDNFPAEDQVAPSVLCWGDARIGNVIYRDFTPAAILDWEMATVGPPELDIAWLIFAHQVFAELATLAGLPGMPDFLREEDVRDTYRAATGTDLGDLHWYSVFAGVVWCCVFMRAGARRVHFGEMAAPTDLDAGLFYHRAVLERLLTTGTGA